MEVPRRRMKRSYIALIVIVVLLAIAIWANIPNSGINMGDFQRTMQLVLGLDLRGGVQVLLEADQASLPASGQIDPQALEDAKQILENRTNALGVSENLFQVAGENRIVGEFPGLENSDAILRTIRETGFLEFVDLGSNPENLIEGQEVLTDMGQGSTNGSLAQPTATADPAATPASADNTAATPETPKTVYKTVMTGTALRSVGVQADAKGGYEISFVLTPEGSKTFADHTRANVGKILAIVLDKKIISAPRIDTAITDGQGVITGTFTIDDANSLAIQMRYGALPIPFKVVESRIIGPTLGADSLNKSLIAGLIGFIVVILFMVIYYRLPGFLAVISILIYALLLLTLFRIIPVTLTLPGIAGFLLSTGSALDANILIFERLKEELRNGRTYPQAAELAWKRAWPSIRDSNIATLITCVILFMFGSSFGASIVKGFAVTLGLGVVVSIFCAYFVTMPLLRVVIDLMKPSPKHLKLFGVID
jgi:preprotein translocase subunit SecD